MKKTMMFVMFISFFLPINSFAVEIKNLDAKAFTLTLTEGAEKHNLVLQANQQTEFCRKGCFLTFIGGDKYAFIGDEKLEIADGKLNFKE